MHQDTPNATVLMTAANPDSWTLEGLLARISMEIEAKSKQLEADPRPVAALVRSHNRQIVRLLSVAECLQRESLAALNTLGPDRGPRGIPRLGPGSKPSTSRFAGLLRRMRGRLRLR